MSFNPSQPRDEDGKWTDSGGGGSSKGGNHTREELKQARLFLHAAGLSKSASEARGHLFQASKSLPHYGNKLGRKIDRVRARLHSTRSEDITPHMNHIDALRRIGFKMDR